MSREMLPVHCHAWTCLSIVTLECTSPAKRFPPKTVNEKKFISNQSLIFILSSYPITDLYFNRKPMNIAKINKYNKKTEQHFYNENKKANK